MAFASRIILYHPESSCHPGRFKWIQISQPCLVPASESFGPSPMTTQMGRTHATRPRPPRLQGGTPLALAPRDPLPAAQAALKAPRCPKNRGKTWKQLRKKLSRLHLGSLKRWMRWVRASWWLISKPLGSLPGIVQDVPWPKLRLVSHSASPFSPYPRKRS